jgi:hypothetical protein
MQLFLYISHKDRAEKRMNRLTNDTMDLTAPSSVTKEFSPSWGELKVVKDVLAVNDHRRKAATKLPRM